MIPRIKMAINDFSRFAIRRLVQPVIWDSHFFALREPKVQADVPQNKEIQNHVATELRRNGINVADLKIDIKEYHQWKSKAEYKKMWLYYLKFGIFGKNLPEKSLEHYIAAKLLDLSEDDVYIDVGSSGSPTAAIYQRIYGCETYQQDLVFPPGINGNLIGGDAGKMPVTDAFASKMACHCSFEHFEGSSDMAFIKEANRVLRRGGKLCILPLYFFTKYAIQTDPTLLPKGTQQFENDAILYCSKVWGNRHGRFYDASHFITRITTNLNQLRLKLYMVRNEKTVSPSCYLKFVALFEKT